MRILAVLLLLLFVFVLRHLSNGPLCDLELRIQWGWLVLAVLCLHCHVSVLVVVEVKPY